MLLSYTLKNFYEGRRDTTYHVCTPHMKLDGSFRGCLVASTVCTSFGEVARRVCEDNL
ncbi:hypothetical protein HanIR_Chr08g0348181 [Helianthus annuus]|nr:hypothetical protein HanIR_Chr08g0348181 [Helianthus annuus]